MSGSARKSHLVLGFFYFLTSILVLFVFAVRPGIDWYYRAPFPAMVYGTAHNPYVQRVLLPTTVRLIAEATPDTVKDLANANLKNRRMVRLLGWEAAYLYEYFIGLLLMLACFVGFAWAMRSIIRIVYHYGRGVSDLAPIGALLLLPMFFRYYSYPYDPPTILLFALATLALLKGRLFSYYGVFLLAALNKETSILLIGVFLASQYKGRISATMVFHAAAQFLIWGATKAFLALRFWDAPGGVVEFHLTDHNLRLPMEHPMSFGYTVVVAAVTLWLVGSGWARKPLFLRRALLLTITPLVVAVLFFGFLDELRDYLEAFIFIFLLSIPTIMSLAGVSERRSEPAGSEAVVDLGAGRG